MKRVYAILALALFTGILLGAANLSLAPTVEPPAIIAEQVNLPAVSAAEPRIVPMAYIEPVPEYSQDDAELIARVLWSECRGESREGWLMVAQCILDRLARGDWSDTLESVIYWPNQFAKPGDLTDELLEVAIAALTGERFSEDEILYFRATKSTKDWHAPYLGTVGGHSYYGYGRDGE